jgi:hypothetical protein
MKDTWSGVRTGPRQLLAMLVTLTITLAAAVDLGRPALAVVGLLGPALVVIDHLAGHRHHHRL